MIIHGNNIDALKLFPDNHFDSIVTDPPYGLGKEPNAEQLMKDWIDKGFHEIKGGGFMGKEWDAFVPQPIFWKEVFRVLKHGGYVVSFFGTRTYDWGVMSMRFAGFEVRDCIQWLYGSGFPKSHNIGKAIDKMYGAERDVIGEKQYTNMNTKGKNGIFVNDTQQRIRQQITIPNTKQAKLWDGWGTALKPANEPIVLARKPLEKGLTVAENVLKWGVGAINIDDCRIKLEENYKPVRRVNSFSNGQNNEWLKLPKINESSPSANENGRFPANIILGCNCENENNHNENCPIRILDEQSGDRSSTRINNSNDKIKKGNTNKLFGGSIQKIESYSKDYRDKGGASRFFYVAKASKSEREKGLKNLEIKSTNTNEKFIEEYENDKDCVQGKYQAVKSPSQNFHPTVKPIKLMQYLVKLVTPPNGIVLDPFCGSGTTGIACKIDGFQFVGIDQDLDYCKIAEARIENTISVKQTKLF
jgi:site-specific DNA-methyltransferase (adenine-specific)